MNLQESINVHGLLNPIIVKRISKRKYRIIDGNSRIGCVKTPTIECLVMGEKGVQEIPKDQILRRKKF